MGKYKWIYIAAVLVAGIGYLATDRRQMLILLLCLLGIFAVTLVCWAISLAHLQYELEVEDVSVCGHEITMKIVLRHPGIIPLGPIMMQLEYENLIFSDVQKQEILLYPGGKKRLEYLLPYVAENCGKTRVRIKRAKIYDLLGIVNHTSKKEKEKEIIIYPNVKQLEITRSNTASSKNLGESYDESKKGQDVSEVFDMRDYHQGDNVKSIHWKLSSKLDRLIVREFGNPVNYHTAMYYDTGVDEKADQKVRRTAQNGVLQMTASLSKSMIQEGIVHHMITVEDMKEKECLVEDNNSYLQMLAEMMSRKVPDTAEESTAQMEIFAQDNRFTNIVFVCSAIHMEHIKQLSRQANLKVVYVNTNEEDSVENGDNYTLISIPVGKIDHKIQVIEL